MPSSIFQNNEIPIRALEIRTKRDGDHFHLTLVSKMEVDQVKDKKSIDDLLIKARKDLKISGKISQNNHSSTSSNTSLHFISLGMGKANAHQSTTYFAVLLWPELLKYRRGLKLSTDDYHPHITLGFHPSDVHGVNKSMSSLLPSTNPSNHLDDQNALQILKRFSTKHHSDIVLNALDILLDAISNGKSEDNFKCRVLSFRMNLFGSKSRFADCLQDSLSILKMDPFNVPALASQAICMISMKPARPLLSHYLFYYVSKWSIHRYVPCSNE